MTSSTPTFQPLFEKALKDYKRKTGKDLTTNPLAAEINRCASPEDILIILKGKANELNQPQGSDRRLTTWLDPTVNILGALSATLGQGVGLVFPPTTIIFSGIGILLVAARGTFANRDMLVQLFERIENFFKRIKTYTEVPPTPDLIDALAKIMAEVLSILAIATKGIQKRRRKIFLKQIAGINEIGDALQKLDELEQGELLAVIARVSTDTRALKNDAKETSDGVKEIISKMDTREHEDFLRDLKGWLSPPEPSTNYELGLHAYYKGTTTWFIEGNIFQKWDSTGSLLWIHGKPGSGKSILCSAIIQHILSLSGGGRAFVAYFYFDFRDEKKKHRHNLLSSLLVQLAAQSITCSDILSPIYSAHGNGKQPPSDDVLIGCLKDMLSASLQHPIYITIDAVDESPDSSGVRSPRAQVLNFIQEIVELRLANLHICITSRPEVDIRDCLEPLTSLRISLHDENGHKEDISKYITSEVAFIARNKRWRNDDKELVIETLSKKADGMFRWVFCQLEMLRLCFRSGVRQLVNELPDTLDETYERVLKEIPKTNRGHVRRLLQCLAVAMRPLRVQELAQVLTLGFHAIQGEFSMVDADSRPEDQEQEILSACPSLITIVGNNRSRVVQFSHFSVKEFLMSGRLSTSTEDISHYHIPFDAAHTTIAQASLGVLLRLDDRFHRQPWNIPLAEYAAEHWVSHVQVASASSRIMRMMETLFDLDKPHFAAWVRIYDMDERSWNPNANPAKPLYYASFGGLYDLVEHLLKKYPEHVNALGGQHDYPLVAALHKGHTRVADLLLQHGANVEGRGTNGRTPLHQSIRHFNDTVFSAVPFLLEHGADANAQQSDLRTPLHLAAALGNDKFLFVPGPILNHTNLVQLLLGHGASVHAEDMYDRTPLHLVVEGNFISEEAPSVVRLLVEHGADMNKRDNNHLTPLHLASHHQHIKAVQVLLDHGANANAENSMVRTPLHQVFEDDFVYEDSSGLVQLLVERGADANSNDKHRVTPLHFASYRQKLESAHVLLDHGANVNAKDSRGRTPLYQVFEEISIHEDRFALAQLLVDRGADVNMHDKLRITPLHVASYRLRLESVRVLLDHGANVNAKDKYNSTPLHRVLLTPLSIRGLGIVQLLLERGADVNARSKYLVTPLHLRSYNRDLTLVQVLLNHGANLNAADHHERTPLHRVLERPLVSEDGFGVVEKLVETLVGSGAEVNTRDKDHITPLHLASYHQHLESVRVLLNHGANVNAKDNKGQTPLHRVIGKSPTEYPGDYVIPQLLLKHGADVNALDEVHETPLHLALRFGWFEGPWVLLKHGADLNVENKEGMTPFQLVQKKMREEMSAALPGYFDNKQMIAERVVLLSLLYE